VDSSNAGTSGSVSCALPCEATVLTEFETAWADWFARNPGVVASYRKAMGEWPMEYRDAPACATCRRHECKNVECRRITYRAIDQSNWPCPSCGGPCHVLLAQHRTAVCRHDKAEKKRKPYRRYAPRTVVRKGDEEEVNNAC